MKRNRYTYYAFWKKLPSRAYFIFILSVFFSFSVFGTAFDLLQNLSPPLPLTIFWSVYSGCVSAGYAYTFTRNRKALIFIIILQFGLPFIHWHEIFAGDITLSHSSKLIFDAICIYLGVSLGYVCFIIFITREGIKQVRFKTEIDLAAEMHDVLVPSIEFNNEKFEIYGKSKPALEIGGDLIDLYKNEKHLTVYIADVSGHGINAGLLMGMFKSAIHSWLGGDIKLTKLINETNKTLHKLKKSNMFVTGSIIRFYPESSVEYLTAGHLPILYYSKNSNIIEHLLIKQIPITVKEDFIFSSRFINYSMGDVFVLLTDGIIEVMDKNGEQFGLNKVEKIIMDNCTGSTRQIFEKIMNEVNEFGKQKDDQSVIIIKSLI